jgi:hypothetical protein
LYEEGKIPNLGNRGEHTYPSSLFTFVVPAKLILSVLEVYHACSTILGFARGIADGIPGSG